jgi:hypothetical protein
VNDAWTYLGVALDPGATARVALRKAYLAHWNVRKVPLYAALPEDSKGVSRTVEVLERVAVVRDSPHVKGQVDHIGIVSPTYAIMPNEETADLLDVLAEESGARFYAAGETEGGRKAFVALKLPGHISVGEDTVECFVTTVQSHDGTMPFTLLATPVLDGIILDSHRLTLRHRAGAGAALTSVIRDWLEDTFAYLEHFHQAGKLLADSPMGFAKFEAVVDRELGTGRLGAVMGAPSTSDSRILDKRVVQMTELFDSGRTAWNGFVALATWFDLYSPVRGDTVREQKALLDAGFKQKALALMTAAAS